MSRSAGVLLFSGWLPDSRSNGSKAAHEVRGPGREVAKVLHSWKLGKTEASVHVHRFHCLAIVQAQGSIAAGLT